MLESHGRTWRMRTLADSALTLDVFFLRVLGVLCVDAFDPELRIFEWT
jgi:hypothetical protein